MKQSMNRMAVCTLTVGASLGALAALSGCSGGSGPSAVSARAELVDRTTQPLTVGAFKYATGTYTSCGGHVDGTTWGLAVSDATGMPTAISVVQDDPTCLLTLTSIVTTAHTYTPTSAIALGTSFGSAQPFSWTGTIGFYANADLSAVDYASNFTVNIPFSDDPKDVTGTITATYGSVTAMQNATDVNAPDYTFSAGTLALTTDIAFKVETQSGSATLTAGSYTGDFYYVDTANALGTNPTFAAIDTAYGAASKTAMATSLSYTVFAMTNGTTTLPITENIVVHRAVNNVPAYEIIAVTFNHP